MRQQSEILENIFTDSLEKQYFLQNPTLFDTAKESIKELYNALEQVSAVELPYLKKAFMSRSVEDFFEYLNDSKQFDIPSLFLSDFNYCKGYGKELEIIPNSPSHFQEAFSQLNQYKLLDKIESISFLSSEFGYSQKDFERQADYMRIINQYSYEMKHLKSFNIGGFNNSFYIGIDYKNEIKEAFKGNPDELGKRCYIGPIPDIIQHQSLKQLTFRDILPTQEGYFKDLEKASSELTVIKFENIKFLDIDKDLSALKNFSNISTLTIKDCKLVEIPSFVRGMNMLTNLDLSQNHIQQIPFFIADTQLRTLNLQSNQISVAENLPIHSLQVASLRNNKIEKLDEKTVAFLSFSTKNNMYLDVAQNKITIHSIDEKLWKALLDFKTEDEVTKLFYPMQQDKQKQLEKDLLNLIPYQKAKQIQL
ncbi:MAG: hypothetical protein MUC49_21290 [Raineya sp.]|jgi:Leucine-rich repeat (LRR) protein|nr:hypothetical protein [Raineya sp.]